MLIFLMLLLPVQWSAALAADCCLSHAPPAAQAGVQQAAMDNAHQHHMQSEQSPTDSQQAKSDCKVNCAACHAHHCPAAVFESGTVVPAVLTAKDDTPYLSGVTSPLPDNLFRPPLVALN